MFSKLTCIEREGGRKADGRRGREQPGLDKCQRDNLGAVIKILSRWEVNRKDFHKTATPVQVTRLGSPLISLSFLGFLFFLYFCGGLEGNTRKVLGEGKVGPGASLERLKQTSGKPASLFGTMDTGS